MHTAISHAQCQSSSSWMTYHFLKETVSHITYTNGHLITWYVNGQRRHDSKTLIVCATQASANTSHDAIGEECAQFQMTSLLPMQQDLDIFRMTSWGVLSKVSSLNISLTSWCLHSCPIPRRWQSLEMTLKHLHCRQSQRCTMWQRLIVTLTDSCVILFSHLDGSAFKHPGRMLCNGN